MQQDMFYVSKNGQQAGPFSVEEIARRVTSRELDASDYVYDEAAADWVMLMAHSRLKETFNNVKPAVSPPPAQHKADAAPADDGETPNAWYVLKGDNKFGPFAYNEILKMLQDKSVFEFDYVWHANLPAWERIASLPEFAPSKIKKMKESGMPEVNEVFFRRRHARISYGASIIVHNNVNLFKGRSLEISSGGAGLTLETASLQPGEMVYLHFKPGNGVPPFNATCEIVSRRAAQGEKAGYFQYGVKFTKIEKQTQEILHSLTNKPKAA